MLRASRLALALLALALGCGGGLTQQEKLLLAVREYHEGLRWGRMEDVISHLPASEQRKFLDRGERVGTDIEVTEYEISRVDRKGKGRAVVRVDVGWVLRTAGLLYATSVEQLWEHRKGAWLVVGQKRRRGVPLPLISESLPPAEP